MSMRGAITTPEKPRPGRRRQDAPAWKPPPATWRPAGATPRPPALPAVRRAPEPKTWQPFAPPEPAQARPYWPGLDGLRALAVVGVLLYHAGIRWIPGGFLGVDLFFVISGYLITTLLVAELRRSGAISFAGFYRRRARRLLPALVLMLVATGAAVILVWPQEMAKVRGDLVAALSYVANWWFIVKHQSYFQASGRPSPFQHVWSLAVEEQFYLIWPALLALILAGRTTVRRLSGLGTLALAGALASTAWMARIAIAGNVPYGADASRVYMGTDTHAMGVLLGAGAAALMAARQAARDKPGRTAAGRARASGGWDLLGGLGLAGVCLAMVHVSEFARSLYRGGFLAFAALACLPVVAVTRPGTRLGAALGQEPLRWLGTRSYAIYLWHWPIFVFTRPQLDVPFTGAANLVLRLALTAAAAEASYRWVEQPIRREGLQPFLHRVLRGLPALAAALAAVLAAVVGGIAARARGVGGLAARARTVGGIAARARTVGGIAARARTVGRQAAGRRVVRQPLARARTLGEHWRPAFTAWGAGLVVVLGLATFLMGGSPGSASPKPVNQAAGTHGGIQAARAISISAHGPAHPTQAPAPTPTRKANHKASAAPAPSPTPKPAAPPSAQPPAPAAAPAPAAWSLNAIGDSVMLGAVDDLQHALPGASLNAVEGRQASDAFSAIGTLLATGHLGHWVVLQIGTNGTIDPGALNGVLDRLAGHQVVLLNVHVPRPWENTDNTTILAAAKSHANVALVDWNAIANTHPSWFWNDGIHLRPAGAQAYTSLIVEALK